MKQFISFSILFFGVLSYAQTNLVKNGGFEIETTNWNGDAGTISPYDKKSGKNSLTINQFVGQDWKAIDQKVSIPKNTFAVTISGWIKTEGIENGKEVYNAGLMIAEFTNLSDKKITSENIAQIKGTTPWTAYSKTIILPEKAEKTRLMLALAQTTGSIYFDDIKVIALSKEDYLKINPNTANSGGKSDNSHLFSNGNFEDNLNHWNGTANLSTTEIKQGNASVAISSKTPEWKAIEQLATIPEGVRTIEISGWLKATDIQQGKDPWNNGLFIVEFKKDENTKSVEDQLIGTVTGTTNWTFVEKSIAIPDGTTKYRIMLAMSVCTGTLLADDIQIKFSK